eukprot:1289979-Ditylum_brightwellii.AAC.1
MFVFIAFSSSFCLVVFSVSFLICDANVELAFVRLATAFRSSAVADARLAKASMVSCCNVSATALLAL